MNLTKLNLIILIFINFTFPSLSSASKIAVLPFKNLSGDKALEQLSDGMSEAISVELLKLPFITLIPKQGIQKVLYQYSSEELTPITGKKVGAELKVDFTVIGDYKRAGDKIEVSSAVVQIIDGKVLKSFKETGMVDDIFVIQSRIVKGISGFFSKNPKPVASKPAPKPAPKPSTSAEDEATYRLLQQQTGKGGEDATQKLLEAKKIQAAEWFNKGAALGNNSPEEISYYLKATEIDPTFAPAHYNLGYVYLYKNMKQEATKEFLEFLKYSDNEFDKEKVKITLKGMGIVIIPPPETGTAPIDWYNTGLKLGNNSDEEAAYYKKAIEIDPTFAPAHYSLGLLYYRRKMYAEALTPLRQYLIYTNDAEPQKEQIRQIVQYLEKVVGTQQQQTKPQQPPLGDFQPIEETPQQPSGTEDLDIEQ